MDCGKLFVEEKIERKNKRYIDGFSEMKHFFMCLTKFGFSSFERPLFHLFPYGECCR